MLSVQQAQAIPTLAHIPLHVEAHNQPKDVELKEASLRPVLGCFPIELTSVGSSATCRMRSNLSQSEPRRRRRRLNLALIAFYA